MVFTHVQILWESVLFPYQICALPPLYGFSVSTQDEPRHSSYWHSIFCVSEFCCARCQIHCLLQLNSLKFWVLLCKNPLHREQKKAWKMFFSHSDTGVSWEVGSASVRWLAWSCADRSCQRGMANVCIAGWFLWDSKNGFIYYDKNRVKRKRFVISRRRNVSIFFGATFFPASENGNQHPEELCWIKLVTQGSYHEYRCHVTAVWMSHCPGCLCLYWGKLGFHKNGHKLG